MSDAEPELDDTVGTVRNEGEPALKQPRTEEAEAADLEQQQSPGMRVSQTLRYQLKEVGEAGLQCASCSGPFMVQLRSPSNWQWWGRQVQCEGVSQVHCWQPHQLYFLPLCILPAKCMEGCSQGLQRPARQHVAREH